MILCLHGFLGQGSDWSFLQNFLQNKNFPTLVAPSLFAPGQPKIENFYVPFRGLLHGDINGSPILLGYSWGARIALHMALEKPTFFKGLILLSPHFGLPTAEQKMARRHLDESWAQRFEKEDWNSVVSGWNAQGVFQGTVELQRNEKDFDRAQLARALRTTGLAYQVDLKTRLSELKMPVFLGAGSRDARFCEQVLAAQSRLSHSKLWIAKGAGHRFPWDAEQDFLNEIESFLRHEVGARRESL